MVMTGVDAQIYHKSSLIDGRRPLDPFNLEPDPRVLLLLFHCRYTASRRWFVSAAIYTVSRTEYDRPS